MKLYLVFAKVSRPNPVKSSPGLKKEKKKEKKKEC
jgi:hypothetical protein